MTILSVNTLAIKDHPYEIGKSYLIRTVTMTQIGRLVSVYDKELVLENVCWVSETGKFSECLAHGIESLESSELEMFPDKVFVNRGGIIDVSEYIHDLPTQTK